MRDASAAGTGGKAGVGEIKLMLSDMDGTLLLPDHSLSPAVVAAVRQLREAGVHFSLASARPPRAMRGQVQQLGIDVPTLAFNGGNLIGTDGSVLQRHCVDRRAVDTALQLFAEHPVVVWAFADDHWLARDRSGAYYDTELHALGYGPKLVDDFTPYLDRIDKLVATTDDFQLLIDLEKQLLPRIEGQALASRSQQYYLDVTALAANKGDALASLADYLHIPLAHTAAIGDGANDVPMFQRAGFAVAMGQADPAVQAHADAVTASNADDGVAEAIERFILPRATPGR
jgi:Cof subfamily protein (haloacid dehalogenase superfamily)